MPSTSIVASVLFSFAFVACASAPTSLTPDLTPYFGGLRGCFTMVDVTTGSITLEYGGDECDVRTAPASTFKIPNALIALDLGIVTDADTVIPWDHIERPRASWNMDHTLATAIWHSVVPYFQSLARTIGAARYRDYLERFHYGNADPSGDIAMFWLEGALAVSPREEARFLVDLYTHRLPVAARAMTIVEHILEVRGNAVPHLRETLPWVVELPADSLLSGKTGTAMPDEPVPGSLDVVGWYVGAVEHRGRRQVFTCRLRSDDASKTGAAAAETAYHILHDRGLL